ncbi:MAG: NOG1 family protein [Methanotrichaceae archaeon]|nr:NOG1 family protein [Methanotrichaceae archaeon]
MFERLPTVPRSQELVDRAFRRSSRSEKGAKYQESMVRTAGNMLSDNLANLIRKFPSIERLPPFYRELLDVMVGMDKMRISLARVSWASKQVGQISREHLRKMRSAEDKISVRKKAFGRMASVLRSVEGDLFYLGEARDRLRKLPTLDLDLPTIIIAGYPNVGKSSFLARVTGARPQVAAYPFTTRGIIVGHMTRGNLRYQVLDTPGLLDRPLFDRNEIELQAMAALRHLQGVVIFLVDPSGHCGYPLEEQLDLLDSLKGWIQLPVLDVYNKCDITEGAKRGLSISTLTGEGVDLAVEGAIELIQSSVSLSF